MTTMKHQATVFGFTLLCSFCAFGCGTESGDSDDGNGGGAALGGGEAVCGLTTDVGTGVLVLTADESINYGFTSALAIQETPVAANTELTFDWSGVRTDFSMHEVDPMADIDMVALILWKLSSEELAVKLNADDLSQSDFIATVTIYTDNAVTSGSLFDFSEFGFEVPQEMLLQYMDPNNFDPATHAYTVMAVKGRTLGKGTHMIQAFRPTVGETNTHVTIDSNSAELSYTVRLADVQGVEVPVGQRDIAIDWTNIETNAMGGEFDSTSITEVVVGRYSHSLAELEAQFLDLDLIGDTLYWGEVLSGSHFSLADAVTDDGTPFTGIDDTGTWLVALRCGVCTNPAPWFLTVMRPCGMAGGAASASMAP